MSNFSDLPDNLIINQLSDFAEGPEKDAVIKHMQSMPYRPFPEFNSFGLRWPLDVLAALKNILIGLPLDFQEMFVDKTTKELVDSNHPLLIDRIPTKINIINFDLWTATTIGNYAYMYMHSKSHVVKDLAFKLLVARGRYHLKVLEDIIENPSQDKETNLRKLVGEQNQPLHSNLN